MIELLGSPGDLEGWISFTPRRGFTKKPTLEKKLVYGYTCPFCENVILACFDTEEPIDLEPYEETSVVNGKRKLKAVIPGRGSDQTSAYEVTSLSTPAGKGQILRINTHVMSPLCLDRNHCNNGGWIEPGDRVCPYTAIVAFSQELLVIDLQLYSHMGAKEVQEQQVVPLGFQEIMPTPGVTFDRWGPRARKIPGIGNVPPAIAMDRSVVRGGFEYHLSIYMNAVRKARTA